MSEWNQFRGDERNTARLEEGVGPVLKPTDAWTVELRGPVACPPVLDHDTVYVGTSEGTLTALDFQGRRRWVYDTTAPTTLAPAICGHRVVFPLDDRLLALDSPTGDLEWDHPIDGLYTTPPTAEGDLVLVGTNRGVIAIRADSGTVIWDTALEGGAVGAPVFDDGRAYVATRDEQVRALDLGSGESVWSAPTDGTAVGGVTRADDRVYVADDDGTLLALGADTGQTWFTYQIRASFTAAPTVLEGEDTLFVAADDETLHVTDTTFGNRKLRGFLFSKSGLSLDGTPTCDPIVVGSVLFVADDVGGLYAIDATDPDFFWHRPLEAAVAATPAASVDPRGGRATHGADSDEFGRLFLGDEDGRLRCLTWEGTP